LTWELSHTEKRAGSYIRQTSTAEDAAATMDRYYERSSGSTTQQRINNAAALMGRAPGGGTATGPSPSNTSAANPSSNASRSTSSGNNTPGAKPGAGTARPEALKADKPKPNVSAGEDYNKFRSSGKVSKNFKGKVEGIEPRTLDLFAKLQGETGKQIYVTSGARPAGWVTPRGTKSGPNNPHVLKKALDLGITGDQTAVAEAAIGLGFTGIGGEGNHLHIDTSHPKLTGWGPDYTGASTPGWLKRVISNHGGSTSGASNMASPSSDAKLSQSSGGSSSGSGSSGSKSGSSSPETKSMPGTGTSRPEELASNNRSSRMPPKLPNTRAQNISRQYGIPDPKYPTNTADDYSVYFNANEPAFGIPFCSV
jgi:hypothetical protein